MSPLAATSHVAFHASAIPESPDQNTCSVCLGGLTFSVGPGEPGDRFEATWCSRCDEELYYEELYEVAS